MERDPELADLVEDRTHGAAEITRRGRQLLARLAGETDDPTGRVRSAVLELARAHPSMAPVIHLANDVLTRLETEGPSGVQALAEATDATEAVAWHAAPEIAQAGSVITYSRSGTVLAAIEAALDEAPGLEVTTSEARPGDEGLTVAERLAQAGADVTLTTDAALLSRPDEATLVLVGADAITADGIVNKTGTGLLLKQAQAVGVPTRVLAATDKLWPPDLPRGPSTDRQAPIDGSPEGVRVDAPVFEHVPLEQVDQIITEEGPRKPDELAAEAEALELRDELVAALRR